MIKGNSYILILSVIIFLLILLVSTTHLLIKILLIIITTGFLFPVIRKIFFKDRFRKIKVAFYSSFIFTIGFFLISILIEDQVFNLNAGDFLIILVVLFYSLMGNLIYGYPVSIIAEFISIKYPNSRFWISGCIHIGFGLLVYLFAPVYTIPAIICSIIFFALDEITRKKSTSF